MKNLTNFLKFLEKLINLNKRQRIIISCFLITLGFMLTSQTANVVYKRYYLIILLGIVTYILSIWALREGMTKLKAIIVLILPTLYCLSFTAFYFLFREIRWLTRLPAGLFLALSFYLLLLSQNVFNVAAIRSIPLYRAAISTSFIFTIATAIFSFSVIFTFNLPFYLNGLLIAIISFPLFLQILWDVGMEKLDSRIVVYSLVMSLVIGEFAIALSFWSVIPIVRSLLLAPIMYALMGIIDEMMRAKLNRSTILEYSGVGLGLFLFVVIITSLR
ncbi:hypothetical protein HYS93_04030 [Candidatus Daviesbacteria bacterium]|nr:hypothetical protein [Candidatus Daviesbacteria bacterium]